MKKQWYTIYAECIEENPIHDSKIGDVQTIGKIKSKGLAFATCVAIQENMKYFKVYFK